MTTALRPTRMPGRRLTGHPVQRPWGRLQVWEAGRGPCLLAVHGLGGSGRYWAGLAAAVGDRFTVVAPDLGGFGHSDKPVLTYDRAFHLDNLDAAVDAANPAGGRVVVVGHSLGGVLAALWAAWNPDRVAALALVATPYPARNKSMPPSYQRTFDSDQNRRRQRLHAGLQRAWPVLSFPVRSRVFPHAVIADFMSNTLQSYWSTAQHVLWDPETEAELAPLSRLAEIPVLILTAEDDRRVPADNARRWAEVLPGAKREVTSGGHQLLLRSGFAGLTAWLRALDLQPASSGRR